VIPVAEELDLKKAARAAGEKRLISRAMARKAGKNLKIFILFSRFSKNVV
jgi:hypothetical protein